MKNIIYHIIICLIILATGFFAGRCSAESHIAPYKNVVTKSDTTIVVDTNIYLNPLPVNLEVNINETIEIPASDIVIKEDSLIVLPISVKTYEGENYRAQVSGFRPQLDWVEVFPETRYIKETMTDNRRNMLYLSGEMFYSDRFTTAAMIMYQRKWKYFQLEAGAGYDLVGNNAVIMTRLKIPLCRW